jgi:N-methylhydantoinase A
MRVGVEVGGTFTDLVAIDGDRVRVAKVPSVPSRPDEGAMAALEAAGLALETVEDLVHGSTVSLNALLERKGARIAFLVTKGFRDLLYLQRHNRRQIYDLFYAKPAPVVGRRDTFEVEERIAADGSIAVELDLLELGSSLESSISGGEYGAVAICLLNAYANPAHERELASWIHDRFPDIGITCSSDITREFREYERASTATIAAYIQPVADAYVSRFARNLNDRGFRGHFSIMQSNGGRLPAVGAAGSAITSLFSGPAAGVTGAVHQARIAGFENIITLDMGGTSTDVCVVTDGRPDLSTETKVDGLPILTPALDIVTVGSGGGSIVWVDDGGMLRVGPRSAGADPGPACYGRGGNSPTITDAHMICGTIRAEAFLGGAMEIDSTASRRVFQPLADSFDMSLEAAAESAIKLADATMVRAIQLVSTERGRDPREYVLVPYGGAGPLHAASVAMELGIEMIVVPPNAGVLSAFGLLAADFAQFLTRTRKVRVDAEAPILVREILTSMEQEARAAVEAFDIDQEPRFAYSLEMRYVGQAFEVPVSMDEDLISALTEQALAQRFADEHIKLFGFGGVDFGLAEIVSFRLGVTTGAGDIPPLREEEDATGTGATRIFDEGDWRDAALIGRSGIRAGGGITGPALVEDETSTMYIPAEWHATMDSYDNLVIIKERDSQ